MKIVCINDLHLNKTVYKGIMDKEFPTLPFRTADFMRSFEWMTNKCINEIKPDLIVISGDVYDHPDPSNEVRGFFSTQIGKLAEVKIPVLILTGNHDIYLKTHALRDLQELNLKNVRVIDQSCIMDFKDTRLLLMPYSMDIEQKKVSIREEFQRFLKEIKLKKSDKLSIFFGHFGVKGAALNQYSVDSKEDDKIDLETTDTTTTLLNNNEDRKYFYSRREDDVDAEWLDELGAEYVLLGDFHRHQKIDKIKTKAFYSGSIERTDINESDQKKGFMIYDSNAEEIKNYGKCRFIEYPNCRPMLEIKGNLTDLRHKFNDLDCSKYQGAIVKLIFIGNEKELIDFSSGLDKFKKEIVEKLNPIHLFHDQRPKRNSEEEKKASEVEKEILAKGHISDEDVLNVVKEMVIERTKNKEEQSKICELATEIYKETIGK